jgi:hypothetical protein
VDVSVQAMPNSSRLVNAQKPQSTCNSMRGVESTPHRSFIASWCIRFYLPKNLFALSTRRFFLGIYGICGVYFLHYSSRSSVCAMLLWNNTCCVREVCSSDCTTRNSYLSTFWSPMAFSQNAGVAYHIEHTCSYMNVSTSQYFYMCTSMCDRCHKISNPVTVRVH